MKPWYQSKTLWFNLLSLVVMVGSGQFGIPISSGLAVPLLAAANIGLRLISSQPLG